MHYTSTAFCTVDDAVKLKQLRAELKVYIESATFRRRVYDDLMWSLKGLTPDWRGGDQLNKQFATLQMHDDDIYIPYCTIQKDKLEVIRWAVFTPLFEWINKWLKLFWFLQAFEELQDVGSEKYIF